MSTSEATAWEGVEEGDDAVANDSDNVDEGNNDDDDESFVSK
jgi:hypothetical protein